MPDEVLVQRDLVVGVVHSSFGLEIHSKNEPINKHNIFRIDRRRFAMLNSEKLPTFDALVAFHQRDPLGYEQFRTEMLSNAINAAPPRIRPSLSRTLDTINAVRQKKTPLEAASFAFSLMCESLDELKDALHEFNAASAELQAIIIVENLKHRSLSYVK
jgi:hypothetical protein